MNHTSRASKLCCSLFKNDNVVGTGCSDLQKRVRAVHHGYIKNSLIKCQSGVKVSYGNCDMRKTVCFGFHPHFFLLCLVVLRFRLSLRCEVTAFTTALLPNLSL